MPGFATMDIITGGLSFLFTILVLSYLVGDNPGFRLAVHAFTGISAGYIAVIAFQQVIVNRMFLPMLTGGLTLRLVMLVPLVLSLLLLAKSSSRLEWLGRPVVAIMVGVGAAAGLYGALQGTLFPQVLAAAQPFSTAAGFSTAIFTGALALIGTITTLAYFQFTTRSKDPAAGKRGTMLSLFALLGQIFISITLGVIFAGVLAASLSALVDRMQALVLFIDSLLAQFLY